MPLRDAAADWYDQLYLPIVTIARERGVTKQFSSLAEADVYLWVFDHAEDLAGALSDESTVREAAEAVTDQAVAAARARTPRGRIAHALSRLPRLRITTDGQDASD